MISDSLRLVRLLGEGGMGSVWIAEQLPSQTVVAVKLISVEALITGGSRVVERFRREAEAAMQIRSRHVIEVLDYGTTDSGIPFLVLELLEGEALAERLERTPTLPLAQVLAISKQVAEALTAAHQHGIVHRDIKPENIFLCTEGEEEVVKVFDFGLAKWSDCGGDEQSGAGRPRRAITDEWSLLGTFEYMSPEQLLAPKTVDHRADLWALGVVIFEMLVGRLPFHSQTLTERAGAMRRGSFSSLSAPMVGLPGALSTWFAKALQPNREQRFASAGEMIRAFELACGVMAAGEPFHPDPAEHQVAAPPASAWRVRGEARLGAEAAPCETTPSGSREPLRSGWTTGVDDKEDTIPISRAAVLEALRRQQKQARR